MRLVKVSYDHGVDRELQTCYYRGDSVKHQVRGEVSRMLISMSQGLPGDLASLILEIGALVCFGLAAFSVIVGRMNLIALGLALLVLDLWM